MIEHKGYDRLVNFTDAVVAIAATLLILPVVEAATVVGHDQADVFMQHLWPYLSMFFLSFAVIAFFWLEHHRMFRRIDKFDTFMIVANFVWIIGIVVMPVPTALIVRGNSRDVVAITFYISTMLLIALSQFVMSNHVRRKPALEHDGVRANSRWLGDLILVLLLCVALVIGFVFPEAGLLPLLLVFLVPGIVRLVRRKPNASPVVQ